MRGGVAQDRVACAAAAFAGILPGKGAFGGERGGCPGRRDGPPRGGEASAMGLPDPAGRPVAGAGARPGLGGNRRTGAGREALHMVTKM